MSSQSQSIKLESYIRKLVPKGKRIASEAVNVIEKYLNETYDRLFMESRGMASYQHKRTIASKEIQMSLGAICLTKASRTKILNKTLSAITKYYDGKDRRRGVRAGLYFPVTRIGTAMRKNEDYRVSEGADVYMAAVLEGLAVHVFDYVSRKYSSKSMITVEMVKEGIGCSIQQPI